jgi:hypothetical protein
VKTILAGPARYSKRAWIAKKIFTANFFKKNGQVKNLYGDLKKTKSKNCMGIFEKMAKSKICMGI